LGKELYAERDFGTMIFDLVFKYNGWAYYAEYMDRRANNPITTNELGSTRFIYNGKGVNQQLSYVFKRNYEIAARYSFIQPNKSIAALETKTDIVELGATKYFNKHRVKAQWSVFYNVKDGNYSINNNLNHWGTMIQVELGI
jgi:hypothetical protein